jgi:2-phosphoglycerate kinase
LLCLVTYLVSRQSNNASDIRAELKDLLRGKNSSEPVKSELKEYLNDPLDDVSLDDEYDILFWRKLKAPRYPVLVRLTGTF